MNTHDKYELPPPAQRIPYIGDVWTRDQVCAAIEADRKTTERQLAAYKRLVNSLESRLTDIQAQHDELKKSTNPELLASERAANAILTEELEADRQRHDRMLAHEWIRPALRLKEDAPYRFDFYAQEIEKLRNDSDYRKRRCEPDAESIEKLAINRYRTVPAGLLAYKVVAGDGSRSLFSGTKDECKIVAAKLTEAFLDGAHVALHPVEPVKVPSDDTVLTLAGEYETRSHGWADAEYRFISEDIIYFARALLARYGTQPAASAEPIEYQARIRPDWLKDKPDNWTEWERCTEEQAADYERTPLLYDWHYQVRRLYTAPVAAQPSVPGWRERFADAVYDNLAAADNQDIPLEEYPARILGVLDRFLPPTPPADGKDNIIITENGGVQLNTHNPEVANKLFALIYQFRSARPSCSQGDMIVLKTAEAFNADIPVTEQEEEEWKRLEDSQ